jgi:hypothetical protein
LTFLSKTAYAFEGGRFEDDARVPEADDEEEEVLARGMA